MSKKKKEIKVVVLLCEGKTDVAFIRRLAMDLDDYKDYKEIIKDIHKPLSSYFIDKVKNYDYDSSNLRDRPLLPLILRRTEGQSDNFLLLYDMNGMYRTKNYREILNDFKELSSTESGGFESRGPQIKSAIGIIYDLDDKSREERLEYIKNNYKEVISEIQYLKENQTIVNANSITGAVGYHLLMDNNCKDLEDIIIPLIKTNNKQVVEDAKTFLDEQKESVSKDSSFNGKKSQIGVIAQLERSGLHNADFIKLTSLFNTDVMKRNKVCTDLLEFIQGLRKKVV